ncbi:MAG: penicillin-binding protein 2 [endosymbiont of Galathealinum brachiosum]|uniref:Peptidoglycan D,D-transpeptidase MrdA n=1 Tax=endosymbiont of Galathealinum brachiosum TaxID=2200906 RepID=A0A370D9N6_9GAMM|nr:MAG: penicillin-binding protein 2 [endosymbiont of Galathealinum brachiosum]
MSRRAVIKNHTLEALLFKRRALVAAIFSVLLLLVLLSRLVYLQFFEFSHFSSLSENNRVRLTPLVPNRGLIYDRNGVVLAENRPSYQLELIPEQIKNMRETLFELGRIVALDEDVLKRFDRLLKRSRKFEAIPLRTKLSEEEVARLAVNRHRFPGVEVNARLGRYYPLAKSMAHVVGYVGRIDEKELKRVDETNYKGTTHIGKNGLERYYEDQLHGLVGYENIEVNVQGRELRVLDKIPPLPGNNLWLTLDARIQKVAEKALEGFNGSVVVMKPHTGEILAMVSLPSFDPNLFVHGISHKDYKRLRDSPDRPLFNRSIKGQYPPGSTVKAFVGLGGLESRSIGHKETIDCKGHYLLPNDDRKYRDWKKKGHGLVDLNKSIEQSCDVYYYELAYRMGINRIHDFLQPFGFGEKTGVDLLGERSGLLPSREWKKRVKNKIWFPGETLITGIGQGYMLATPLQLASATSILGMRGEVHPPHLLKKIGEPGNEEKVVINWAAKEPVKLKRESNWRHAIKGMVSVVHSVRGTARSSGYGLNYKIAGKTGTAQVFGIAQDAEYDEETIAKKLRDHALFIAFAPYKNPEIAVAVIAENGSHGSSVAAPIARKVIDEWERNKKGNISK